MPGLLDLPDELLLIIYGHNQARIVSARTHAEYIGSGANRRLLAIAIDAYFPHLIWHIRLHIKYDNDAKWFEESLPMQVRYMMNGRSLLDLDCERNRKRRKPLGCWKLRCRLGETFVAQNLTKFRILCIPRNTKHLKEMLLGLVRIWKCMPALREVWLYVDAVYGDSGRVVSSVIRQLQAKLPKVLIRDITVRDSSSIE